MGNVLSFFSSWKLDPFPSLHDTTYHILTPSIGKFLKYHTFGLIHACEIGNYDLVQILLNLPDIDINSKNYLGRDALMTICFHGYRPHAVQITNLLLKHGAKPTESDLHGSTCLMEAASGGHIDLVELLLHHGADINAKDKDGTTVFMYACMSDSIELVKYLIAEGAKFWEKDFCGCNSIQYALTCGSPNSALISDLISSLTEKTLPTSDTSDQTTNTDQTTASSSSNGSSGSGSSSDSPTGSGSDSPTGSESPTPSNSDSLSSVSRNKKKVAKKSPIP